MVFELLQPLVPDILRDEPLKNHTSFKIGGPADVFVSPQNAQMLVDVLNACDAHDVPITLLGMGTNVLVADGGIRGVVVSMRGLAGIRMISDDCCHVAAGESLSALAAFAQKNALSGLEFAGCIPGTVGGAVCMNAGAYGSQISDICTSVSVLCKDAEVWRMDEIAGGDMGFGYRTSKVLMDKTIVLGAIFQLQKGSAQLIREQMDKNRKARSSSQPIHQPSAGSIFKHPTGHYAGKLIEDAGLKGFRVGDAQVSGKHAGFIVNIGSAKAADVLKLIDIIRKRVSEKFGIWLKPEVRFLGVESDSHCDSNGDVGRGENDGA